MHNNGDGQRIKNDAQPPAIKIIMDYTKNQHGIYTTLHTLPPHLQKYNIYT